MNLPSAEQLNHMFDASWPYFEKVDVERDGVQSTIQFDIRIDPELSYLAGHFPGQPVVPGVVQVHWVGELATLFFTCQGFQSLKKVKFSNTLLPATSLQLVLNYNQESKQVRFEYKDNELRFSSGVMAFQ